ncbi:MAG: phosphatase PAP2 family protein [Solobacterium sp.]|nr:phosphatase PAP2 family protein [Solobacterium sp.]
MMKPILIGIVYLAIFLIVERWDYPISEYLTKHSLPAINFIGARFGPLPTAILPAWCLLCLGEYREKNRIFRIVAITVLGVGAFNVVKPDLSSMLGILMVIIVWAALYALVRFFPIPKFSEYNETVMWFSVTVSFLSQGIVQLMKMIWGRPRYIAIQLFGVGFRRWYEIAGLAWRSDFYRSFPSGHTAMAASMFLIVFLPRLFPEKNWSIWYYWVIGAAFTAFVAATRIFSGMHFVSDVMAGCGVFLLVMGIDTLYMRKRGRELFPPLKKEKVTNEE